MKNVDDVWENVMFFAIQYHESVKKYWISFNNDRDGENILQLKLEMEYDGKIMREEVEVWRSLQS